MVPGTSFESLGVGRAGLRGSHAMNSLAEASSSTCKVTVQRFAVFTLNIQGTTQNCVSKMRAALRVCWQSGRHKRGRFGKNIAGLGYALRSAGNAKEFPDSDKKGSAVSAFGLAPCRRGELAVLFFLPPTK